MIVDNATAQQAEPQGCLTLTRTELHLLSRGRYREYSLTDLNRMLNRNPIVIDESTALEYWTIASLISAIVVFLALFIWHTLLRFLLVAGFSILAWGIASIFRPNTKMETVLIAALYAIAPAVYIEYLLDLVGLSIFWVQTFFWLLIWIIVLVVLLRSKEATIKIQPLDTWRAVIGLPLGFALSVSVVIDWQYEAWLVLGIVLLTLVGFVVAYLWKRPGPPVAIDT